MTEPGDRPPSGPNRSNSSDAGALADTIADAPLAGARATLASAPAPAPGSGRARATRPTFPGTVTSANRYRVGAELGRGGMGRVVEAFDEQLARTVAVKEVLPRVGADLAKRFTREVQITARFEHPSIIPLYDSGITADGRPFYVMRRVTGRPLSELFDRARTVGERLTLLPHVLAAIDAVAHAHRRGVIHRDLKPANILVGELGETVVIDWGLAKVLDEDDGDRIDGEPEIDPAVSANLRTQLGAVFGTPGFMAPEQARGEELDARSDVYALGATLYQLLAGSPPHGAPKITATQLLDRARTTAPAAIATLAPGAPAELTAIVDQAVAFEPAARYPDAEALGADVRRFLAGQLVAAHRYTPRQRLIRFARKHRAALAVAAIGALALAVLGAVSIGRIVHERDAADAARLDAQVGRAAAESARDRLADENDALRISEARAYLGTFPTHAVAVLKHLPPTSRRAADALGVACEAAARGTAWALPTTAEIESALELSAQGNQLLEGDSGELRGIDLVKRRVVWTRRFPELTNAAWVENGARVLIARASAPPSIYDPVTGTDTPLVGPGIDLVHGDARGQHFVLEESARLGADWLDVASGKITALAPSHRVVSAAIDPEARWAVILDDRRAMVVRPDGTELGHLDGAWSSVAVSRTGQIAVADQEHFATAMVDPSGASIRWETQPTVATPNAPVLFVQYRDRWLYIVTRDGRVQAWTGKALYPVLATAHAAFPGVQVGPDLMVIPDSAGVLHVLAAAREDVLPMPIVMVHPRVAGRVDNTRLVVAGSGHIVVWDLAALAPVRIAARLASFAFPFDDHTLLLGSGFPDEWQWYDLRSRTTTAIDVVMPTVKIVGQAPDGRLLLRGNGSRGPSLFALAPGSPPHVIASGDRAVVALLPDGNDVFATGDNRVLAEIGGNAAREVLKLDGPVTALTALGPLRYAALSAAGELVRGSVVTGVVERTHIDLPDAWLSSDAGGQPLLISGRTLYAWDSAVRPVAEFEDDIDSLRSVAGGELVVLRSHRTYLVDTRGTTRPEVLLAEAVDSPSISLDGTLAASRVVGGVTIVELPTRTHWTFPFALFPDAPLWLMPSSRQLGTGTGQDLELWQLPRIDRDLPPWLDELTNAIDVDGVLSWPWQQRTATSP